MKIEVRASNVPISEPLALHIVQRLKFALRRYASRVEHVVVRLVDLNGPKGGPDKRCTLSAQLSSPGERLLAAAIDADAYVAVSQAAARLDARASRVIRRARESSRPRLGRFRGGTRATRARPRTVV